MFFSFYHSYKKHQSKRNLRRAVEASLGSTIDFDECDDMIAASERDELIINALGPILNPANVAHKYPDRILTEHKFNNEQKDSSISETNGVLLTPFLSVHSLSLSAFTLSPHSVVVHHTNSEVMVVEQNNSIMRNEQLSIDEYNGRLATNVNPSLHSSGSSELSFSLPLKLKRRIYKKYTEITEKYGRKHVSFSTTVLDSTNADNSNNLTADIGSASEYAMFSQSCASSCESSSREENQLNFNRRVIADFREEATPVAD